MTVTVYGASDDGIVVEGAIVEEFEYRADEDNFLACSDGTVLRVEFARSGVWRLTPVVRGVAGMTIAVAAEGDPARPPSSRRLPIGPWSSCRARRWVFMAKADLCLCSHERVCHPLVSRSRDRDRVSGPCTVPGCWCRLFVKSRLGWVVTT